VFVIVAVFVGKQWGFLRSVELLDDSVGDKPFYCFV
jgi:hypothetical protein